MDFEEYLWANGVQPSTIDYLRECFEAKSEVSPAVHETMKKLFYSYIVVGGMPQVVQKYVDTHDIGQVIENQREIIEQYRLDISQYAEGSEKIKIRAVFDSIPAQLNDKNRRFYVNSLDKNARLARYENSFKWLDDAGVALPCYNVTRCSRATPTAMTPATTIRWTAAWAQTTTSGRSARRCTRRA